MWPGGPGFHAASFPRPTTFPTLQHVAGEHSVWVTACSPSAEVILALVDPAAMSIGAQIPTFRLLGTHLGVEFLGHRQFRV